MNAYTTTGQARIQPHDLAIVSCANQYMAAVALAAFERQRGYHAEAEVEWLLKHYGVTPQASASRGGLLLQRIGAALVRVGDRLAGLPRRGVVPETVPVLQAADPSDPSVTAALLATSASEP